MGKPFGKASRRTFIRNGTPHSLNKLDFTEGENLRPHKNFKTTAFRSLEGRFAHVRYATVR